MHYRVIRIRVDLRVCCAGELLPITLPIINERLREEHCRSYRLMGLGLTLGFATQASCCPSRCQSSTSACARRTGARARARSWRWAPSARAAPPGCSRTWPRWCPCCCPSWPTRGRWCAASPAGRSAATRAGWCRPRARPARSASRSSTPCWRCAHLSGCFQPGALLDTCPCHGKIVVLSGRITCYEDGHA